VVDSEGHRGYGEAPQVWQVTGASLAGNEACVSSVLGPLLRGRDPDDLVASCRAVASAVVGNEAAKGALDVALAWVSDRVRTPILADESVFGVRDLVEVIRRRAADMVNVKLAKCGGLSAARTLLSLAHEQGIGTIVGSMMEGPIGVGAAASLVAAYGTSAVSDLDAAWWLAASPVQGGPTYDGPYVCLPDAPGLGVSGVGDPDGERMGSD
jgi:L-alanine-DL-glutamate epimerase-like enolase superfamily enzyme